MPRRFYHDLHDDHLPLNLAWLSLVRRWHLRLAAYVVLAAATGYALTLERDNATHQRSLLATATQQAIESGCEADNDTRFVLRTILEENYPQIKAQEKSGRLTHAEAATERRLIKKDILLLRRRDCNTAAVHVVTKK